MVDYEYEHIPFLDDNPHFPLQLNTDHHVVNDNNPHQYLINHKFVYKENIFSILLD